MRRSGHGAVATIQRNQADLDVTHDRRLRGGIELLTAVTTLAPELRLDDDDVVPATAVAPDGADAPPTAPPAS